MKKIEIKSELSGSIWKVLVSKGQEVSEGDQLIIMESMKMEIPITAPTNGVIDKIEVIEGSNVSEDVTIIILRV